MITEQIQETDSILRLIEQLRALLTNIMKLPLESDLVKVFEDHIKDHLKKKVSQLS